MITVGIDCGSQNTKAALLNNGILVATALIPTAFDLEQAATEALKKVLAQAKVEAADMIVATGVGRDGITFANDTVNEVTAAGKGAFFIDSSTQTVIDLGAESCRVVDLSPEGKINHYEVNDKCASGAGTFIETMARTLQVDISEIGDYSLLHTKKISMVAQCVVFAESEVVSLIHENESIENIAFGVLFGVASKVITLLRRRDIAERIMIIGGTGHNNGLVTILSDEIDRVIKIPADVDCISAVGAAVVAQNLCKTD